MGKVFNITVDEKTIEYTLVRSSRKTIGITVDKDGQVKVSAPLNINGRQAKDIVLKKASWIIKKQEEVKRLKQEKGEGRQFVDGELLLYLGQELTLRVREKRKIANPEVILDGDSIVVTVDEGRGREERVLSIKHVLKTWYVNQFENVIRERIPEYASLVGASPGRVTIREQKTRWGSCSGKGNINLNWKLIMAPQEVLDYVIVHELCHMKEMNHSKKFWSLVGSILPDYSGSRKWLKENGHRLEL